MPFTSHCSRCSRSRATGCSSRDQLPNPASVALHQALGFEEVGVYRRIGWKAGAWRDVIWLARQLGPDTHETE